MEFGFVDYYTMTEVDFAYKYFDWEFYLARRNMSVETMSEEEVLDALREYPFHFSDKTIAEINRQNKYNFVSWGEK